ncbi:nucleoside hydrolase [Robbsia sp. Bb-Pol-6]|uniref:Nucleoside hydrolase n=1 Tax=Robbsia betulipollinis TaxID=2981849 RepID=A0ABT3ZJY5_9BURK|nr:nucleoside hydrolase [Robbsia betulipollinis]MCY0386270.1 nucleoside hydrolase [Robbsia betulipollinis]
MKRHQIIYDTDPGVDDAMALLFLAAHPDVALRGVTTVFGNGTLATTTRNALHLTEHFAAGTPVFAGAAGPLAGTPRPPVSWIHGDDAMGDIAARQPPSRQVETRPAHRFIIDAVRAEPGTIALIAVGPLTNLARALHEAPDIAGLVKAVYVMGGAFGFHGMGGNVTPCAEANILCDPDAADRVFGAGWPVTLIGLDVTQRTLMMQEDLAHLRDAAGAAGRFIWDATRIYQHFHQRSAGFAGIYVHDSSAVACCVAPELYTVRRGPVRVVCEGLAIGQTIQKPLASPVPAPAWDDRPPQDVCVDVDVAGFLALYRRVLVGNRRHAVD